MFDHLFSPLNIGNLTLPNRICFCAHQTNFAEKQKINQRLLSYYRQRANGGCALIIMGDLTIHPLDLPWAAMIKAYDPSAIPDFKRLSHSVHEAGTKIFANLNHYGFQSSGAITRHACIGPSAISDVVFGEMAKPMEEQDMEMLVTAFKTSAAHMIEAGFDGIEIDMGHASLLRQFLSPLSNHRQDDYGQSIENRMRLPLRVLHSVRDAVGKEHAVGIRLCMDEMFWGAITLEESTEMARIFESSGSVDFFQVSVGNYYNLHLQYPSMHVPDNLALEASSQLKQAVGVPVIGAYQIRTPAQAQDLILDDKMDMAGMIRPLICDPELPAKAIEGRPDDIRICVHDNKGCTGRRNQSKSLSCVQNPDAGYEYRSELQTAKQTGKVSQIKKIWVVGAGPAGLAAAGSAGKRGHDVIVFEKQSVPGGQINLHAKGPGRAGIKQIVRYLCHELAKLKIPIRTQTEVNYDMIISGRPDAVIVATGSVPDDRGLSGDFKPPFVQTVPDILEQRYPVGDKVLFIDENGGHSSTATVEFLADQGKKVDMVTSELFIGIDLASIGDLYLTRQRLLQKGVTFITDTRVEAIEGIKVSARNVFSSKALTFIGYDTIGLNVANRVDDTLYFAVKKIVKELYRVGDCVAPRGMEMAIFEGRKAGEAV
jgi:mycofactocin system FadH/OYE family oxidoreductase 2